MAFTCQPHPRSSAFAGVSVPPIGAPDGEPICCAVLGWPAWRLPCSACGGPDHRQDSHSTHRDRQPKDPSRLLAPRYEQSRAASSHRRAEPDGPGWKPARTTRCSLSAANRSWRSRMTRNVLRSDARKSEVIRMRTLTVAGAAICPWYWLANRRAAHAQTTPPQSAPPTSQADGRGRGPQGPPLLPTPPLTAPPTPDKDGNFVIGPPHARTRTDRERSVPRARFTS